MEDHTPERYTYLIIRDKSLIFSGLEEKYPEIFLLKFSKIRLFSLAVSSVNNFSWPFFKITFEGKIFISFKINFLSLYI